MVAFWHDEEVESLTQTIEDLKEEKCRFQGELEGQKSELQSLKVALKQSNKEVAELSKIVAAQKFSCGNQKCVIFVLVMEPALTGVRAGTWELEFGALPNGASISNRSTSASELPFSRTHLHTPPSAARAGEDFAATGASPSPANDAAAATVAAARPGPTIHPAAVGHCLTVRRPNMRGRHFLNPLLSPLAYQKPPSSRLAPRRSASHAHRAVAPPRAARRSPLSEPDVGISRFASALPGFRGALKQRYSDFVVHEVALDGSLVRLTSFDLPDGECVDAKEGGMDEAQALESFRLLCGDADCEALRGFLERISEGGNRDVSPIILSADADKAHRSEVHDFFKRNFESLLTDTVEHSDGIQRCIRVRLKQGRREWRDVDGRVRNRKGTGSSGWRDDRPFDSRGSIIWPDHLGKFIRFHLYKENKDTQEALGKIGKMLGLQEQRINALLQPNSHDFSGSRASDQVTVFKVQASRLVALNRKLSGIKVGDFSYVKEGLALGQLMGNRFTITLRSVVAESEHVINAAVDGLITSGFINYYGLQRFGSGSVPNHQVGAALLRGDKQCHSINKVREHFKEHGDIGTALRNFPRYLITERAIRLKKYPGNYLQALMAIPRTLRLMYVHSYQSYLWNHAASMRVEKYEGDLVYKKESPFEQGAVKVISEDDDQTNSEMSTCCETLPEEIIQSVKIADSEDLSKSLYTFEDVVLPLPGSETLFPGNEVAGIYHVIAKRDGINLRESIHGVKDFSITSMKGGYRRVIQRPIDFEWYVQPKPKSIGNSDMLETLAVKLAFTLPASSYATMAIRELMKTSTSIHRRGLPAVEPKPMGALSRCPSLVGNVCQQKRRAQGMSAQLDPSGYLRNMERENIKGDCGPQPGHRNKGGSKNLNPDRRKKFQELLPVSL
uniref:TRUD domain-containing protein n=1 Tax=Oryza punctata TaxID=4537 RepID=A0A0E0JPB4_ORYPU